MKTSLHVVAVTGALLAAASVQAQAQQSNVLGQLLGAVFGNNQQTEQTLESDWNQGRRPFAQRREQLDARIDVAVQNGTLGRREAAEMRREYDDIVRLEEQYSADGNVSPQQRNDLRMRYRALMQQADGQGGYQDGNQGYGSNDSRWQPLSTRNAAFEQRIATGLRNRTLSQAGATRLRADWRALAQIEAGYQRGGIDSREQADLEARYATIDARMGGSANGAARWSQMETRLAAAERNGSISRNEATMVRAQLGDLARLDAAYANSGNSEQRGYLARRYGELETVMSNGRR